MPTQKARVVKRSQVLTIRVLVLTLILLVLLTIYLGLLKASRVVNVTCTQRREATSQLPAKIITATDYFDAGNYYYDTGDCVSAVVNYTKATKLNSKYAEAYNNLGYTYMMMSDFARALPALGKAIESRPDYVHALMNRGDVYNYSYLQNRKLAIADYDAIISSGKMADSSSSVCGHRLFAIKDGNLLKVFFKMLFYDKDYGCQLPTPK